MLFDTSGHSFGRDIIMLNVRWYLTYKLSYRDLEEMCSERGIAVDHTTIYRWVIKFAPDVEKAVRQCKAKVGKSWRLDETYIKIKGQWNYLYRAVDKDGNTVDYLLTAKRDKAAAKRFLVKAIGENGVPEKITIDKSGANLAAINAYNAAKCTRISPRSNKYLNNVIEQDHRVIKQLCRATLGFQSFRTAGITIGGFEAMRIIKKGQVQARGQSAVETFYLLVA